MAMFALNYKCVECQILGGRIIFNVGDLLIEWKENQGLVQERELIQMNILKNYSFTFFF
jgi:hypothetical protein